VALGDHSSCSFLVTLGGCHHLDGLDSGGALAQVGDCLWPSLGDCEGFVPTPAESRRQL